MELGREDLNPFFSDQNRACEPITPLPRVDAQPTSPTLRPMTDATAVIMAAGKGTRMKSALPKVLLGLCGRPLIGWVVAAVEEAGIGTVVVDVHPGRGLEGHVPDAAERRIRVAEQRRACA